jgi:hypothetical protein
LVSKDFGRRNHTIAKRMVPDDARALLIAPLDTVIREDSASRAWFTVDRPSTQFPSVGS